MPSLLTRYQTKNAEIARAVRGSSGNRFGDVNAGFMLPSAQPKGVKVAIETTPNSPLPAQGQPSPAGLSPRGVYLTNWPYKFTVPQAPYRHPGSLVSVEQLRKVADTWDIVRACIQHLKKEVAAVPLEIVVKETQGMKKAQKAAANAAALPQIQKAKAFFGRNGGLGGHGFTRSYFEGQLIEDLCVVGAAAIYYETTLGGEVLEVDAVDASTIRPRVDAYGFPGPGEHIWEQWIYGTLVAGYTADEMSYSGLSENARSWTPFYASPVEWLIAVIMSAMMADDWNNAWLTDGNMPDTLIQAPETWTPEQIFNFQDHLDMMYSGDNAQRRKAKIVPKGMAPAAMHSRRDQDFQEFELWKLRRVCSIMGVQPASLGFSGEQYKVSQEDSMDSTSEFGVRPLLDYRKETYDDLLERLGYENLEAQNVTSAEEKALERAQRNVMLVSGGIKTPNEARSDEGDDPIDDADVLLVPTTMQTFDQMLNPPEPPAPVAGGVAPGGAKPKPAPADTQRAEEADEHAIERAVDLKLWERKAQNRRREGKAPACAFSSEWIGEEQSAAIFERLEGAETAEEVSAAFAEKRDDEKEDDSDLHDDAGDLSSLPALRRLKAEREA